jgi:hypothetical protein
MGFAEIKVFAIMGYWLSRRGIACLEFSVVNRAVRRCGRPLGRMGNRGMAAFLGEKWKGAARGLALALAVLAGISLTGGQPASAALRPSPRLRHALHRLHVEHLEHLVRVRALRTRPWEVEIPAIGVAVDLTTLGDPDGPDLPVPPLAAADSEAGWYRFTSVPGSAGNSVIVGHVDTDVGPAVFYNLYQLVPGDAVDVLTDTGTERFVVRWVREVPKVAFPVDQVFGETGKHQLWLITCGGAFDYQTGHYMDNIIVSAVVRSAVEPAPAPVAILKPVIKNRGRLRHRATRR